MNCSLRYFGLSNIKVQPPYGNIHFYNLNLFCSCLSVVSCLFSLIIFWCIPIHSSEGDNLLEVDLYLVISLTFLAISFYCSYLCSHVHVCVYKHPDTTAQDGVSEDKHQHWSSLHILFETGSLCCLPFHMLGPLVSKNHGFLLFDGLSVCCEYK